MARGQHVPAGGVIASVDATLDEVSRGVRRSSVEQVLEECRKADDTTVYLIGLERFAECNESPALLVAMTPEYVGLHTDGAFDRLCMRSCSGKLDRLDDLYRGGPAVNGRLGILSGGKEAVERRHRRGRRDDRVPEEHHGQRARAAPTFANGCSTI